MQVLRGQGPPGEARGTVEVTLVGKGQRKISGNNTSYLIARGKRMEQDGKRCFCDCMVYQQHIRPWVYFKPAGSGWLEANRVTSSRECVPTGTWSNEDTFTMMAGLADDAKFGCNRGPYRDAPGVGTKTPGLEVLIRYNMRFLLWDACQSLVLNKEEWTLDITGRDPSFNVRWSPGLTQAPQAPPGAVPFPYVDRICT